GAVTSNTGTLRLSRRLRALPGVEALHVWALAEDADGALYAGAGDGGKVVRIGPDGESTVGYAGQSGPGASVAGGAKGRVIYAGTGPEAEIVRIDADGAKSWCKLAESYVWALAMAPKGDVLYAATGPHGKIYQVTSDGKSSVFYDTKQDHVLCLAV